MNFDDIGYGAANRIAFFSASFLPVQKPFCRPTKDSLLIIIIIIIHFHLTFIQHHCYHKKIYKIEF